MTDPLKVLGFIFWLFSFSIVRGQVNPQTPTMVSLVPVTTQKSTFVMCVIEDFYPKDLTVQWKVNYINKHYHQLSSITSQSTLKYNVNAEGLYTTHSLYKVSSETWNANSDYTCEVTHQGNLISVTRMFNCIFNTKLTLTLKPPIERELFVSHKVVLEAVVSGDDRDMVEEASVLCKVKNEPVHTSVTGNTHSSQGISNFTRIHNITVDTKKWFDGEKVTCSIRDTTNNRDIEQEISFDKGDGQKPVVVIYRPDDMSTDTVSQVCEVTSSKLGDVYIMWRLGNEPYIKGSTSAHIHQRNSVSVLSILTLSKQQYENPILTITCAVIHANMEHIGAPLQVSPRQSIKLECPVDY